MRGAPRSGVSRLIKRNLRRILKAYPPTTTGRAYICRETRTCRTTNSLITGQIVAIPILGLLHHEYVRV
jgi:hypothetical protein